jgi:hypothetical protein
MLAELRASLLADPRETCAVLFGRAVSQDGRLVRVVIREVVHPEDKDYESRTSIAAQLRPAFVAKVAQRARQSGESLLFAHSHPFPLNQFSPIDDCGERALADFLAGRTPDRWHGALLVTPEVTLARGLGNGVNLPVMGIGPTLVFGQSDEGRVTEADRFNRQVKMFGAAGQERLRRIRVGVVGLGGTGSIVAEQLAHLGVGSFCLIDPDVVEVTNLNRLVGAGDGDVGRSKVAVAVDLIARIAPAATVSTHQESVLLAKVAARLLDVDFVFCCTDSQGSRSVLNQLAHQFLIPMIDQGVSIVVTQQHISHIVGRANMLAPGLGCFVCGNLLDPEAVRVDLLTDFERNADPYIAGAHEAAPAVISLNGTMASMAVTMFLNAVLGLPGQARYLNYNAISGATRAAAITIHPTCVVCSRKGASARANEWPLPGRLA